MKSLPEQSTFIIKIKIKTVTPLSACTRNWCTLTAFKKLIVHHNNNWHSDKTRFRKLGTIARVQSHVSHRKACLNFPTFLPEELSDLLILNYATFYYLSRFILSLCLQVDHYFSDVGIL